MTNRVSDINGFWEIRGNPLSKVGVFPYEGHLIPGAEPGKIYNVYRPAEELSDPECIESFKLLPWIDGHVFLGDSSVATPPEEKGVEGVIGEDVYFDAPYLRGNIKVFSSALKDRIERREKELSCGYRCTYEKRPGVFNGQAYDYIQRRIRGNHLALVGKGRMGADVAVLDSAVALDHFSITLDEGFSKMEEEKKVADMTPEERTARIAELKAELTALEAEPGSTDAEVVVEAAKVEPTEVATQAATAAAEAVAQTVEPAVAQAVQAAVAGEIDPAAMDAAIQKRIQTHEADKQLAGKLYEGVSQIVGAFDHALMSARQVAEYGARKLNLNVAAGGEIAAIQGYLAAYRKPQTVITGDSAPAGRISALNEFRTGV